MRSIANCCRSLIKSTTSTVSLTKYQPTIHKFAHPSSTGHQFFQSRQKSDTIFENLFESPRDPTKVHIDEVLAKLGERGIKRNGNIRLENKFKLFQLDENLLINESKLHREMVRLQRDLHPDKYLGKDRQSQIISEQLSALVNEAHETLKHPYKRAIYLLCLKSNRSANDLERDLDKLVVDPEFLSRMMDTREQIERGHGKLDQLAQDLQMELKSLMETINKDLEQKNYDSVVKYLGKLKFVANCHVVLSDRLGNFSNF